MRELLQALCNPDVPFLRNAFIAGMLASVAFGIMGSYVIARRISYIAAAIAHCVLGGIGVALYLQKEAGLTWLEPMYGAVISALLAALIIGLVSLYAREREDSIIGALWASGMAIGILFLAKTSGYVDPSSYLLGSILLIGEQDLWFILALDVLVATIGLVFYNKLVAVCFDEEFARLRGVHVEAFYLLLLCLTALTVVLLVSVVGIVMVIALLTLPAAVAGHFTRRMWQMMAVAVLLCMAFTATGLGLSYAYDLPSGATIILIGGGVYLLVMLGRRLPRR